MEKFKSYELMERERWNASSDDEERKKWEEKKWESLAIEETYLSSKWIFVFLQEFIDFARFISLLKFLRREPKP